MEMVTKREHRLKKIFHLKMITKRVTSDKGYYLLIKGLIHQEDIRIIIRENKIRVKADFPGGSEAKTALPVQGAQVQPLEPTCHN